MSRLATFVGNSTNGTGFTQPTVNDLGQVSGTVQLDLATYDGFELEPIGPTTINFTGLSTNNRRKSWIVLKNGGVTEQDITFDSRTVFDSGFDGLWSVARTPTDTWDITTANFTGNVLNVGSQETSPFGLAFNSDGTKLYFSGNASRTIHQYNLSTPWDLSTAILDVDSFDVSGYIDSRIFFFFGNGGNYLYVSGLSTGGNRAPTLYQFSLSTAWDITTATEITSISMPSSIDIPQGIFLDEDGNNLFVVSLFADTSNDRVYRFTMTVPWDITSLVPAGSLIVANPRHMSISTDGTQLFLIRIGTDTIFLYEMSTPWDITTASYTGVTLGVSSEVTECSSLFFGAAGTKLYVLGYGNDVIAEYDIGATGNNNVELISVNQLFDNVLLLSNRHLQVN